MERTRLTVYNQPFFVNKLLHIIQPISISSEVFEGMVKESQAYDSNTMLTAMTRQVDNSGMVPNFAGVYGDPQDVLEALMNLGHSQLLKISQLDLEIQKEVFETLIGEEDTTLRALLVLDECQREVIGQLMQLRKGSPLAIALRNASEGALRDLYLDPESLHSQMFDDIVSIEDQCVFYSGEPHICYLKHVVQDAVVEVWQFFYLPNIKEIPIRSPFDKYTVGEILETLTPKVYQKCLVDDSQYDPRMPSGFMGLLGKVGGALPRLIAGQVKKNEQLRKKVMREEEISAALYELFTR